MALVPECPLPVSHGGAKMGLRPFYKYTSVRRAWLLNLQIGPASRVQAMNSSRVRSICACRVGGCRWCWLHWAVRPMQAHCFSQQPKGRPPNPGKMTALLNLEVDVMFAILWSSSWEISTTTHGLLTHLQYTRIRTHSLIGDDTGCPRDATKRSSKR